MPRKEPYRTIDVRRRILAVLEPLRLKESEGELRGFSVNAYCEKILWDYALGKLVKKETPREDHSVSIKLPDPFEPTEWDRLPIVPSRKPNNRRPKRQPPGEKASNE